MPDTPYYGFTTPALTDPPDGPGQMATLAGDIEATLRGGYQTPDGNITVGDDGSDVARMFAVEKLDGVDRYAGRMYIQPGGPLAFVLSKNDVEVGRFRINVDNTVGIGTGSTYRPVPYSIAAVQVPITITTATNANALVTYPVNARFTQTPIAIATGYGSGATNWIYTTNSNGATSCNVNARHVDNTSSSATVNCSLLLVQMLTTAGPGPAVFEEERGGVALTVTCHTAECGNAGVAIPVVTTDPDPIAVCGGCGRWITDVAAG